MNKRKRKKYKKEINGFGIVRRKKLKKFVREKNLLDREL